MYSHKLLITRLICFYLFLITFNANALKVKVHTNREMVEKQITYDGSHNITLRYLPISIGGVENTTLNHIDEFSKNDIIEVENNEDSLSLEPSQRLLTLLNLGWHSSIKYVPFSSVPSSSNSRNPPCSFIMFHIVFGNCDFTSPNLELHDAEQFGATGTLTEALPELMTEDIITLSSSIDRFNKNSVLYLGNDIFLSWDSYSGIFRFQNSNQISSAFRGSYNLLVFRKQSQPINELLGEAKVKPTIHAECIEESYSDPIPVTLPGTPCSPHTK